MPSSNFLPAQMKQQGQQQEAGPEAVAEEENVRTFTEEEMKRMVRVEVERDEIGGGSEIIEVPWHLLMQSAIFDSMWKCADTENAEHVIPWTRVTAQCFRKIVEWMAEHHGKPEQREHKRTPIGDRIWFILTDWERAFFEIDYDTLMELLEAANFLEIKSLYYYCIQESARHILNKESQPDEQRAMLDLDDDVTEEEKAALHQEFVVDYEKGVSNAQEQSGGNGESGSASNA